MFPSAFPPTLIDVEKVLNISCEWLAKLSSNAKTDVKIIEPNFRKPRVRSRAQSRYKIIKQPDQHDVGDFLVE